MTENSVNPPRRSPLWMRILLGVSLALNLAVVGLAVGASLRLIGPGGPPPHSFGGALIRAMPAEDRKAIGRQARAHIGRSGHKADSAQLIAALRATPYDQSVVVELLEAQAAGRQAFAEALQTAWLERVQAMTDAERMAFADGLEAAEARRKKHYKGGTDRKD